MNQKQQIKLFNEQVSGKTPKFSDSQGKYIYKELSKNQLDFYSYMKDIGHFYSQHYLKEFIPRYFGKTCLQTLNITSNLTNDTKKGQWINHISQRNSRIPINQTKQYIVLENLLANYEYPCTMDIKLGKKKKKKASNKKFQLSTTNSHNFRINGMSIFYNQTKEQHFISKYYFQKTPEEEIQTHLSFFFFDGKSIDVQLLNKVINQIKEIVLALTCFNAGFFDSTSLFIAYDAFHHSKFKVKIIDFDKYHVDSKQRVQGDQNIIVGLKYIIWYLKNIATNYAQHQSKILRKQLNLFHQNQVIPQYKIDKFNIKSPKEEKEQVN